MILFISAPNAHCSEVFLHFQFEGQEINLDSRMGIFITMNPGYAGRTELPESVKALFRPVVVIVPDLQQICEIMLFSEGFLTAKVRKLYCYPYPHIHPCMCGQCLVMTYIFVIIYLNS